MLRSGYNPDFSNFESTGGFKSQRSWEDEDGCMAAWRREGERRSGGNRVANGGPPVGRLGIGFVLAGWVLLAVVYVAGLWSIEVTFFVAVGWLTLALGCLSAYAAVVSHRGDREPLRLPEALRDFEEYFRWLTPVAFTTGMIFAHFFWH